MANGPMRPTNPPPSGGGFDWARRNLLLPLAMGGAIGGSPDPAQAAISFMRMRQQQEQWDADQKRQGQQMAMEQRRLGLAEKREARAKLEFDKQQEEESAMTFMWELAPGFMDEFNKRPETWGELRASEVLTQINEKYKKATGKTITMRQLQEFDQRFLPHSTGKYMAYYDPAKQTAVFRKQFKKGDQFVWRDVALEHMPEIPVELIAQGGDNPMVARAFAHELRRRAKLAAGDPEKVKALNAYADDFDKVWQEATSKGTKREGLTPYQRTRLAEGRVRDTVRDLKDWLDSEESNLKTMLDSAQIDDAQYLEGKKRLQYIYRARVKEARTGRETKSTHPGVYRAAKELNPDLSVIEHNYFMSRLSPEDVKRMEKAAEELAKQKGVKITEPTVEKEGEEVAPMVAPAAEPLTRRGAAWKMMTSGNRFNPFDPYLPGHLQPTGSLYGPPMGVGTARQMMRRGAAK